jgi:hypothetical protein
MLSEKKETILTQKIDNFFKITELLNEQYTHLVYQPILDITYRISFDGNNVVWYKSGNETTKYRLPPNIFLKYIKVDIDKKIKCRLEDLAYVVSRNFTSGKSSSADVNWDMVDFTDNGIILSFNIMPYTANWCGIKKFQTPYKFTITISKDYIIVESVEINTNVEPISATLFDFYELDNVITLLGKMLKIRDYGDDG